VTEVIRALDTDVLAVQEIVAPGEAEARRRLCQLADDTGLRCLVSGPAREPVAALGLGARGYHLGLLWRDGIEPVPGSYRTTSAGLWHALAWVTLDVGGARVRHAVFHASPFGTRMRASHNEIVVASLARPGSRVPALAGADWNGESADRVRDPRTGAWVPYEPRDPYQGVEWFEDLVHQCGWDYGPEGQRRHWADLSAGEVLWAGGLHDAAAVTGAPWQATAGHYPADPYGARGILRRIDAVKVTPEVVPALREHWVTSTELTRTASDHLPVTVEYVPSAITPGGGA
jgi:endonuclease/exonuclease/phosphatase family metal-dependent hydrolase